MGSESFTWPKSFGFINEFLIFIFCFFNFLFFFPRGLSGASRFVLSVAGAAGTAGFQQRPWMPSPAAIRAVCVRRGGHAASVKRRQLFQEAAKSPPSYVNKDDSSERRCRGGRRGGGRRQPGPAWAGDCAAEPEPEPGGGCADMGGQVTRNLLYGKERP